MTQLPSSKKTRDLTKLPEQLLCRGNASNCLWQQTARVSKTGKQGLHYINCPENQTSSFCLQEKYLTAEQRKRVLPSGRVTTSPKPIVIHWNQPCMDISHASFPLGAGVASPGCHTVLYSYSVVPTLLRSLEPKLHVIISYVNKVIHTTQPWQ